jgi:phage/plasmid-like protein (TIGR03299 family)
MSHELEQLQVGGDLVTSFAFTGGREDIWHRLGQSFDGRAMTAEEAMRLANMNRLVKIVPMLPPGEWAIPEQYYILLEGLAGVTDEGELFQTADKIVGIHGKGGADSHREFTMRDRFLLAEAAIHASNGEAVWSTAGMLRNGTQGFATMEAPPVVIDPKGINDVIRQYLTLIWSFDGSRTTELSASEIRVVCANTMSAHDYLKLALIKVRHTSHTSKDRFEMAAHQWAIAQDRAKALELQANRLLAVREGKQVLHKLIEHVLPIPTDGSKRAVTLAKNRQETVEALWHAPTNAAYCGDNGWAAWNTFVEYLDWEAPVKCSEGETEADRRLGNQFDGTHDALKVKAANFILAQAS